MQPSIVGVLNTLPCSKKNLVDDEIIISDSHDEFECIVNENRESIKNSKKLVYVIQPTANCALGCKYCGQKHPATFLGKEKQEALLDRINKKLEHNSKPREEIEIRWFWDEPLLEKNIMSSLSARLQHIAQTKKLKYSSSIVTNGLHLDVNTINAMQAPNNPNLPILKNPS